MPLDGVVTLLQASGFSSVQAVDATGDARLIDPGDPWVVVAQSAPAHQNVEPATPIALFVALAGEQTLEPSALGYVAMPDLLQTPVGTALDALVALGLTSVVLDDFSGALRPVPADATWTVLSQNPVAGAWVQPGSKIALGALPAAELPEPAG